MRKTTYQRRAKARFKSSLPSTMRAMVSLLTDVYTNKSIPFGAVFVDAVFAVVGMGVFCYFKLLMMKCASDNA